MIHRNLMAIFLVIAIGSPATAQDVSGVWSVTWAQGVRIERGGEVEVQRWGEATLELMQEGEAVSGTWTRDFGGGDRARWSVTGRFRGGRLELQGTEGEADDPDVATELARVESINWEGTLTAGRLEGEMWLVIPEMPRPPVRLPWSAER